MTTGEAKGSGRRGEILEAALEIADARGLSAVTMRAVAERVGVTAMALYPHVQSKNDLLDGLVGRLLAEFAIPSEELPWQDRLRVIARSMWDVALRHPSVVSLLFSRPAITPDGIGVVDALFRALLDAGVPPKEIPRIERMFSTFIIGYAASETGGRFAVRTPAAREQWRARLSAPDFEFPAHHKLASYLLAPWSHQEEFEADLDDLVALIRSVGTELCARATYRGVVLISRDGGHSWHPGTLPRGSDSAPSRKSPARTPPTAGRSARSATSATACWPYLATAERRGRRGTFRPPCRTRNWTPSPAPAPQPATSPVRIPYRSTSAIQYLQRGLGRSRRHP